MSEQPARERILNVPAIIVVLVAVFCSVHAIFTLLLTERQTNEALLLLAFIPARYDFNLPLGEPWPGGFAADIWTFVTYAFLHGDLNHLLFNSVWLLAFGSPVARRFGSWRFLMFFAVTAAAGAGAHLDNSFRPVPADDRRIRGDFRCDGGRDAVRISARRAALDLAR